MIKYAKPLMFAVSAALISAIGVYFFTNEDQFMVEFGAPDAREEFTSLLTEHGVSYELETDHLGRVWIIPDQANRDEFRQIVDLYEKSQEAKVRTLNRENQL